MSKTTWRSTIVEVRPYDADIRKIIEDNSVKELQALEDAKFMAAVDEQLLSGPWRRWHEEVGFVHMSGMRMAVQERWTKCGIFLGTDLATTDEEGMVNCLACLT